MESHLLLQMLQFDLERQSGYCKKLDLAANGSSISRSAESNGSSEFQSAEPSAPLKDDEAFDMMPECRVRTIGLATPIKLPCTRYPSQALRFLRSKQRSAFARPMVASPDSEWLLPAKLRLEITIVGAGLGGLSTAIALARGGHSVVVLEQASKLGEVGAGIQIPPNSGRLLRKWGVMNHLDRWAAKPESINFRRWENGIIIGHTALDGAFQDDFEEPYYVVHRAHFHEALVQTAQDYGVELQLGRKVVEYQESTGCVVLDDGTKIQSDLVVAADGIKSIARAILQQGHDYGPRRNGFAAYRATVDVERMRNDPEVSWVLEKPALNIWIGEDRHVMTYTIAAGKSFNMVLSHIDRSDPSTWARKSFKDDVLQEFAGWDPCLTKIISLIDECVKWPLMVGAKLPHWSSASSKLVLVGDAAHAMLPYMSQGAAMAVEDGAALAEVLRHIECRRALPFALKVFEKHRMRRAGDMQDASSVNGVIWHFADGPEQEARDASMIPEVQGQPFSHSANQWSDPATQWWAYGFDAEAEMNAAWTGAMRGLICQRV